MTCSDAFIVTALLLSPRHRKKHIKNVMENLNVHWHHAREPPDHTSEMNRTLCAIYGSTTIWILGIYCQKCVMLAIALLVNAIWNRKGGADCKIVQSVQRTKRIYNLSRTAKASTSRWAKKVLPSLPRYWHCEAIGLYDFITGLRQVYVFFGWTWTFFPWSFQHSLLLSSHHVSICPFEDTMKDVKNWSQRPSIFCFRLPNHCNVQLTC